jgi:hypothetical protein
MMARVVAFLTAALALTCLPAAGAGDKAEDYLTADGKLKERVEVRELQGGFAGLTGTYYAVEADGSWSTGQRLPRNKKGDAKASGKLSKEQVAALAKDLARHQLASLTSHGESMVNPKVTEIDFGKKTLALQPRPGKGGADEDKAVRARYQGIADAVKAVCKGGKAEEK